MYIISWIAWLSVTTTLFRKCDTFIFRSWTRETGKIAHRRNRQRVHLPRSFPHYMYLRLDLLQHNAACDHFHLIHPGDHQEFGQGRLCNNTDPKSVVGQIFQLSPDPESPKTLYTFNFFYCCLGHVESNTTLISHTR